MGARVEDLSGAETDRLVRLADEHGMAVGLGEERDGAQGCAVLLIELARRVDEAHGGFAAIHDRYALEFVVHRGPSIDILRRSTRVAHAATASSAIAACSAFKRFGIDSVGNLPPCGSR